MKNINKKGYTLVELIVSIAIIGILFSIIVVVTNSFYRAYNNSRIDNERLQEEKFIVDYIDKITKKANSSDANIEILLKEEGSWTILLESCEAFSFDQNNITITKNGNIIKKFNHIRKITIKKSGENITCLIVEIIFDNESIKKIAKNLF